MSVGVLLVDDSAIIRGLMNKALTANPNITIVGSASDGKQAISMARELKPQVIILDIEMPVMDGITALPEIIKVCPDCKIIMSSTLTVRNASISLQALALGAADYLAKPTAKTGNEVEDFYRELTTKVLALGGHHYSHVEHTQARPVHTSLPATEPLVAINKDPVKPIARMSPGELLNPFGIKALAIASSTGGPQALTTLFTHLKGHLKDIPIFITQHMPPTFTTLLAEQLTKCSERPCAEGKNGDVVAAGQTYIAPGDFHMVASKNPNNSVTLSINKNPQENFCRPAADPMLRSLSAVYGTHLAVVVLTGMGQDGMEGAKEVVRNGGSVVAQDEGSCVVYGMPKAVVDHQLCKAVLPLSDIGQFLIRQIDGR
jgi:two-component system chemotaxis response regulator CheB